MRDMSKLTKFFIIFAVLTFCGKPDNVVNESEIRNIEIAYDIVVESTSGELSNVYEISGIDTNQYKFLAIPDERIILKSLKYNETGFFNLKIDNLEINNICYSPTVDVINSKNNDTILISYNHVHNTVGIFGSSVKDIAISLSEQIIDRESYWVKNDNLYSENC
tara:strand:+ start:155 stop:646 length:492 start_codon:yes stop_codon:yes gene_type:complete